MGSLAWAMGGFAALRRREWVAHGLIGAAVLVEFWFVWGGAREALAAVDRAPSFFLDFDRHYYPQGLAILRGEGNVQGFGYSPFVALLFAPFGWLAPGQAKVVWLGVQALALALLWGTPIWKGWLATARDRLVLTALVASAFPVLHNFMWGQVSTLLVAVLLLGAGALAWVLPLVIATKFFYGVSGSVLLGAREWRGALVCAGLSVALLLVVPGVVLGPSATLEFYREVGAFIRVLQEYAPTDSNSQFVPFVLGRVVPALEGAGWLAGVSGVAGAALVWWIARPCAGALGRVLQVLLLLGVAPFFVATSWPHYFVFLPVLNALLLARAAEVRGRSGLVVGSLAGASAVASSSFALQLMGGFERYGFWGVLLWANLASLAAGLVVLGQLRIANGRDEAHV